MSNRALIDALRKAINGPNRPQNTVIGIVKSGSIDTGIASCTVEPLNGDADIVARYMADVTGKTNFIPADGSVVAVQMFSPAVGVIILFSELTEINLLGSNLGGLVKINDLLQVLNALQNDLNNIKSIFTSWVPVPNDGGAALKTASASWAAQTITPTTLNDIENANIKHGDNS